MKIGEIVGICITQVLLANKHIHFGRPSYFYRGKKLQFWATLLSKFSFGGLLLYNGNGHGKL